MDLTVMAVLSAGWKKNFQTQNTAKRNEFIKNKEQR